MSIEAPLDRYRGVVRPDWIDYNGHMNVAFYLMAFDHATDVFFDALGLTDDLRERTGSSTFAGELHITYKRELKEADPLRITTQLLAFDEKRMRFFHQMYHAEAGFLAATMENLALSVDLSVRRVSAFPPEILENLRTMQAVHDVLALPEEAGRTIAKPPLPVL